MPARLLIVVAASALALAATASPAVAAIHGGTVVPMAVLGIDFPSVKEIVSDVVKFFFSTLLDALTPDWLRDGSVNVIRRLVTIPNPTDARVWPTLARLSEGMRWIALPLLSLAAVASWVQQWVREMSGRPGSMAQVLPRTALAALLLVAYPVLVSNTVALVNSVTNAMLGLPAVQEGLERTVGLVFAGSLLSGRGVLLAILGIAAVVLAVGLFMLSTALLILFAIVFVSAPLAIACSVLDETRGVWIAWRRTVATAALVPVGWCILFATAGAFMVDVTTWSGGIAGTVGARFTGVFAALIILWLAVRWPLMLLSTIRTQFGGALLSVGRAGGPGGQAGREGGRAARAALQRAGMRSADSVSGALGATRRTAVTSAQMALGQGRRLLAAVPGGGVAAAAGASVAAATAGRLRPLSSAAAPVTGRAREGVAQTRERARTAGVAAKAAYADGANSRQAAAAGLTAAAGSSARPGASEHGSDRQRATDADPSQSVASGSSRSTRSRKWPADTPGSRPGKVGRQEQPRGAVPARDRSPAPASPVTASTSAATTPGARVPAGSAPAANRAASPATARPGVTAADRDSGRPTPSPKPPAARAPAAVRTPPATPPPSRSSSPSVPPPERPRPGRRRKGR